MKKIVVSVLLTLSILPSLAFSMAQWDDNNRPELMENNYERNFSKLPKSAKLKTLPWSDDYWGTYRGGISYRWNQKLPQGVDESVRWSYNIIEDINNLKISINELSPAEKYDLYLGHMDFPLTKYEKERTQIMKTVPWSPEYNKDFKIPEWEGICHDWAPASFQYKNSGPITVIGKTGVKISFGSSDMHALLDFHLEINKTSKTGFLGSRCNLDFKELKKKFKKREISRREMEEQMNSAECKDTNAGAFHVALTNQIGLMNEGFVVDVTRDAEVWNQPVYSYDVKVLDISKGATPGAAPGTVQEITVHTTMGYVGEIEQSFELVTKPFYIKKKEYEYRLELNADGEIVGGEWISFDRPDFIWKSAPVSFKGYFKELEGLYNKSVHYLAPKLFTDLIKSKIKDTGRMSLLERHFISAVKIKEATKDLKKEAHQIRTNNRAVEAFKEAGKIAKEKRVKKNIALLKKDSREIRVNDLAVKGFKEAGKIAKEKRIKKNDAQLTKDIKPEVLERIFITKVEKDAKETRKKKEAEKTAAKKDLKKDIIKNFLEKKFVTEVEKDTKATRAKKELDKKAAKKDLKNDIIKNFLEKKFVTEVSKDAKAKRAVKENDKKKAKAEVLKQGRVNYFFNKFAKEMEKVPAQKKLNLALMEALKAGDLGKTKKLLKDGASPAFIEKDTGLTPLMVSIKTGKDEIIKEVLNVTDLKTLNAVDKQGRNALIWAIVGPNQKPDRDTRALVRDLLDKNIDVNQKDISGKTALAYVTSGEYKSKLISWALKNKGAKI